MIDRAGIAALIPHQGTMCLLDHVEHWDDDTIRCVTTSHQRADNPLRADGRIAAVHLVEYGAQAMAIHGRLLEERVRGDAPPKPGVLVTAREVQLAVGALDARTGVLTVGAWRLMGNPGGLLYRFEVREGARVLASGRVGVLHPA